MLLISFVFIASANAADANATDVLSIDETSNIINNDTNILSTDNNNVESDENVLNSINGTYTDLQRLINETAIGETLKLNYDFGYNTTVDGDSFPKGVIIDKNIVIDGAGHTINGNYAYRIFDISKDNVELTNINFINSNNTAVYFRGTGKVNNCKFTDNTAASNGGAIYGAGSVTNCTFINNTATSYGGAISGASSVTNCTFTDNSVKDSGGAISGAGNVTNCIFISNTAYADGATNVGGAISGASSVTNCTFINNTAKNYGGAIYDAGNVTNCYFIENTADEWGGAICIKKGESVTNCNFTGNTAHDGGAIYFLVDGNVTNCNFTGNTAHDGGAIFIYGTYGLYIINNVTNCNFYNNNANGFGSAIYTINSNATIITNTSFLNNRAKSTSLNITRNNDNIEILFTGANNLLNAIYAEDSVNFTNVTYWGANGITNTDIETPTKSFNEVGQNIKITVIVNDNLVLNTTKVTDTDGKIILDSIVNIPGKYEITARHDKDSYYTEIEQNLTFIQPKENLTLNATAEPIIAGENATIIVTGFENATGDVTARIDGGTLSTTIVNGTATFNVPGLTSSTTAYISYEGDANYNPASTTANLTVIPKSDVNIVAENVTKYYHGPERFVANVYDSELNPIANKTVSIIINRITYTRTTDENGTVSLAINLGSGTYAVITQVDSTSVKSSITVLSTVNGSDITKYYRNATQYSVQVYNTNGTAVGKGEIVTFNINGRFYNRTTDENGIATLNINLPPSEYIITADYKGCKISNNIKVLPVLKAEDITMKYMDGTKFKANLIDGQGNPYKNQFITFNVNGILYNRLTDSNGQAALNIRLPPGEYIITSSFNGANIANKITITG